MTVTNTTLYQLIGRELEIVDGAQSLNATDTAKISDKAAYVRAWLLDDGKVYWVDNAIPDAVALPLAQIIAGEVAPDFSRGEASDFPYTKGPRGYQLLCEHVSKRSAHEPVEAEYF
jgi:hypothetical protein